MRALAQMAACTRRHEVHTGRGDEGGVSAWVDPGLLPCYALDADSTRRWRAASRERSAFGAQTSRVRRRRRWRRRSCGRTQCEE